MYVRVVVSTYSKSMNQPDKVANPARGQLNRENECFLSIYRRDYLMQARPCVVIIYFCLRSII